MDVLFLAGFAAALVAGFVFLIQWAWREDRKTTLRERFKDVVSDWGKEE